MRSTSAFKTPDPLWGKFLTPSVRLIRLLPFIGAIVVKRALFCARTVRTTIRTLCLESLYRLAPRVKRCEQSVCSKPVAGTLMPPTVCSSESPRPRRHCMSFEPTCKGAHAFAV